MRDLEWNEVDFELGLRGMMKTLRELDIFDLGELVLLPHSCVLLP